MFFRSAMLLALIVAPPLFAQAPGSPLRSPDSEVRDQWNTVSKYLARSAAAVTESSYGYKPVATVRSFGQIVAHVAGSQMMFCAAALGEPVPKEDDFEKRTTMSKAELIAALDASNTYCARAYQVPSSQLGGPVEMFGQHFTKGSILLLNATHDNEHYGNIVTYMRMLGLVPPSSQPAQ